MPPHLRRKSGSKCVHFIQLMAIMGHPSSKVNIFPQHCFEQVPSQCQGTQHCLGLQRLVASDQTISSVLLLFFFSRSWCDWLNNPSEYQFRFRRKKHTQAVSPHLHPLFLFKRKLWKGGRIKERREGKRRRRGMVKKSSGQEATRKEEMRLNEKRDWREGEMEGNEKRKQRKTEGNKGDDKERRRRQEGTLW